MAPVETRQPEAQPEHHGAQGGGPGHKVCHSGLQGGGQSGTAHHQGQLQNELQASKHSREILSYLDFLFDFQQSSLT